MVFYKETPIDRILTDWISEHTIDLQSQKDFQRLAVEEKRLAAEDQQRQRQQDFWDLSVRDWHAKPESKERTAYIDEVVSRLAAALAAADPQRSQAILDYGKRDGYIAVINTLYLLLALANKSAVAVDLSKISVSWVVWWIMFHSVVAGGIKGTDAAAKHG